MKKILMSLAFTATTILLITSGQVKVKAAEEKSFTYEKNIDLVKDFVIDSKDLASLAKNYNKTSKSTGWNTNYDINSDGIVDIYDLTLLSKAIGKEINIEQLYDFAEVGQNYKLQSPFKFKLGEKDFVKLSVKWNSSVNTSKVGTYTHTGVVEGYNKQISFDLTVVPVNIDANITNFGFVTSDGTYIYYSNPVNGGGLYKANVDGSNAKKINDDFALSINVHNGWLYYVNMNDKYIYKVKTDGSSRTLLSTGYYELLRIYKGKLYCTDLNEAKLYSMNLDGTDKRKLIEGGSITAVNFEGDYIYCNIFYGGRIDEVIRCNLDGTEQEMMNIHHLWFINVSGDYIYYCNAIFDSASLFYRIIRANLDGTNIEVLNNDFSYWLILMGDWVYYLKPDASFELFTIRRVKIDGSVDEELINSEVSYMNIRAGRIYFSDEDGNLYCAKMDGTDIQKLN